MVRQGYERAGLAARVEPFLFEMDREMKAADLVVCRAGATTLAEITASAKARRFWCRCRRRPTTTSARTPQELATAGAAEVIDQRELSGNRLAVRIFALAADRRRPTAA